VRKSKDAGHSHQFGERLCVEFFHYVVPMNLHGDFSDSNLSCGLLVHQAGDYQRHHLSLAKAEPSETGMQCVCPPVPFTPVAIAVEGSSNSIQNILVAKWLGKKFNRSSSNGPH
jgi:hypothetical protein